MDFPLTSVGFGRSICVVGVGSAGCRVVSQISKECKMFEKFVYVSSDEVDIAMATNGKKLLIGPMITKERSPYSIRGSVSSADLVALRQHARDSRLLIIVSGLGGIVGSALAPLIVKELRESSDGEFEVVAILIMPHSFEASKHFYAGCALRQITRIALGIILVDNDDLFRSSSSDIEGSLIDSHAAVNQQIALALNTLMASGAEEVDKYDHEVQNVERRLTNLVNYFRENPCCLLNLGDTRNAQPKENKSINDDLKASAGSVFLTQTLDDHKSHGRGSSSFAHSSQLRTFSSLSETKFAKYDPVEGLLLTKGANLDETVVAGTRNISLDACVHVDIELTNLEEDIDEVYCSNPS